MNKTQENILKTLDDFIRDFRLAKNRYPENLYINTKSFGQLKKGVDKEKETVGDIDSYNGLSPDLKKYRDINLVVR